MLVPDVNILIHAYRQDAPSHARYREWLDDLVNSNEAFGIFDLVCSGFIRIVTHPGIFNRPTPLQDAFDFLEAVRRQPGFVSITPSIRHWEIFLELCLASGARGNLVPDAYLAALAIESGSE